MHTAISYVFALVCLGMSFSVSHAQTQILKYRDYDFPIPSNTSAREFNVVTFNLFASLHPEPLAWSIRKDGVFEIIDKAKPDIFCPSRGHVNTDQ